MDSLFLFAFIIFSLVYLFRNAFSAIVTAPLDMAASVGQRVVFDCSADESRPIDWYFIPGTPLSHSKYASLCTLDPTHPCIVLTSGGGITRDNANRYNVTSRAAANGIIYFSMLSIETVDLSHAGAYRCHGGYSSKANAFLTILGKTRSSSVIELGRICVNCVTTYKDYLEFTVYQNTVG